MKDVRIMWRKGVSSNAGKSGQGEGGGLSVYSFSELSLYEK